MQKISWSRIDFHPFSLFMAATEKGLCYVGSPGSPFTELEAACSRRFPEMELIEDRAAMQLYQQELNEYFEGTRKEFSVPLDVKGTPFQEEIWQALVKISYGQSSSYSDIAAMIGRPSAVRAVGTAIGANPVLIAVPCHRVIGKSGAMTGYRGGIEMKEYLLAHERGV